MTDDLYEQLQYADVLVRLDLQHQVTMNITRMYRDGHSLTSIAERIGIDEDGVRRRLRQALRLANDSTTGGAPIAGSLCLNCHTPIHGTRRKQFCSDRCRKAYSRRSTTVTP